MLFFLDGQSPMLKVRFAPSPTGYLHLGNARTALINWLFARKNQGIFLLRIDDTDMERSNPLFEKVLREDLAWLGLHHEEEFRQRDRLGLYAQAVEHLKALGRLYPCYETAEELSLKRKMQLSRGVPPLYDRAALHLTPVERQRYEDQGRLPHWRFRLEDKPTAWTDLVRGTVIFQGSHLSDPVLIREDGSPVYTLSSVVDDIEAQVTHIIRGEDHVTNTAIQIQLMEALGKNPGEVHFAHTNLLTTAEGEGLSKRLGSLSLQTLRSQGVEPMAVNSYLAKLGTSEAIAPYGTLQALIEEFHMDHFSRSSPKFSESDLWSLNAKLLHHLPFEAVKDRLPGLDETFWMLIRENLGKLSDVQLWETVCKGCIDPVVDDQAFLQQAQALLPPEPWTADTFSVWTVGIKEKTGRKGKDLFMPLRLALTGQAHGPALNGLLPLMGLEKVLKRLKGQKA